MPQSLYFQDTISQSLTLSDTITAVEKAFKSLARGNAQMPAKSYVTFDSSGGDLRTMPAYSPEFNHATVKIVNAHPQNPVDHNLPTVMAMITAVDPRTGTPEALLDGTKITSCRTAAASAIATNHLSPESASELGIIGTGTQARDQLKGQVLVRNIRNVYLYDHSVEKANQFKNWIQEHMSDLSVQVLNTVQDVVSRSDVLISLTPSEEPVASLNPSDLRPTVHINAMGADAPKKSEWPKEVIGTCKLIVDHWEQASHSGEISQHVEEGRITKENIISTLGDILLEKPDLQQTRTLFDSTGLAIQDTAATDAFLSTSTEPDLHCDFFNLSS